MDPITIQRLGHIRHQEIVAEAARYEEQQGALSKLSGSISRQISRFAASISRKQRETSTIYDTLTHTAVRDNPRDTSIA